ncbi:MAG: N-acetylneuraminate synthase family protein [Vicinamibacterales bacterium]|nr:N-acetylneuraminate synthase family protein [Vicinamibacterales bacterium]
MRFSIGSHAIGPTEPLFVVAEIGLNHGGSLPVARAMIAAAASAGASAVKFQTLHADTLVSAACPPPAHVTAASLRDFFRAFELSADAYAVLADDARRAGLAFLSTPFDEAAVDLLECAGCDAYKIASGDITHTALLRRVAATGKPIVLSTGMSGHAEIVSALDTVRSAGGGPVALLHCVSVYPVPHDSQNLRAVAELADVYNVPVGLSDHSTDPQAAVLAVALGATIYEKHFMLAGQTDAVDAAVSATPDQLAALIQSARLACAALGDGRKQCLAAEAVNLTASRRSLYAQRDLRQGEVVTPGDVIALRPSAGLEPRQARDLIGRVLARDVSAGGAFLEQDLGDLAPRRTTDT